MSPTSSLLDREATRSSLISGLMAIFWAAAAKRKVAAWMVGGGVSTDLTVRAETSTSKVSFG